MRTKMNRAGRQARRTQPYRRQAKRQFNRTLAKMKRGRAAGATPPKPPVTQQQRNPNQVKAAVKKLSTAKRPKMTTKQRQATRRIGKGTNVKQERRRKRAGKSYDSSLLGRRRRLRRL